MKDIVPLKSDDSPTHCIHLHGISIYLNSTQQCQITMPLKRRHSDSIRKVYSNDNTHSYLDRVKRSISSVRVQHITSSPPFPSIFGPPVGFMIHRFNETAHEFSGG